MVGNALALPRHLSQWLFEDADKAAQGLAIRVAQQLRLALAARGLATLVVSGGRTPVRFLELLSNAELDWSMITISLADDRWVADDHPDSNAGLVRRHLLRGKATAARFVSLVDAAISPEKHLPTAEHRIAALTRPFDTVVLGMGEDGHTASLFPAAAGTNAAMDMARPQQLALITPSQAAYRRITMTLRALLDARAVMLLIQGEGKRAVIERACIGTAQHYPVAAILQQHTVPVDIFYSR